MFSKIWPFLCLGCTYKFSLKITPKIFSPPWGCTCTPWLRLWLHNIIIFESIARAGRWQLTNFSSWAQIPIPVPERAHFLSLFSALSLYAVMLNVENALVDQIPLRWSPGFSPFPFQGFQWSMCTTLISSHQLSTTCVWSQYFRNCSKFLFCKFLAVVSLWWGLHVYVEIIVCRKRTCIIRIHGEVFSLG